MVHSLVCSNIGKTLSLDTNLHTFGTDWIVACTPMDQRLLLHGSRTYGLQLHRQRQDPRDQSMEIRSLLCPPGRIVRLQNTRSIRTTSADLVPVPSSYKLLAHHWPVEITLQMLRLKEVSSSLVLGVDSIMNLTSPQVFTFTWAASASKNYSSSVLSGLRSASSAK